MTVKHVNQKKQRCPKCGEWLVPKSIIDWEKEWSASAFRFHKFPKSVEEDNYLCKSCGYTTAVMGSDNRNIQAVLSDIIQDNLSPEERRNYINQANDTKALTAMYDLLSERLQSKNDMNGLAALLIGLVPQGMRESLIVETTGMPLEQVMEHLEARVVATNPDPNLGDLAVALAM